MPARERMAEADLIIVAEADDPFPHAFAAYAADQGAAAERLTAAELACLLSISVADGRATLSPTRPLLLRPLRGPGPASEEEDRFVWSETFAAVWSLAALSPCPVVNRPDEWGWVSRSVFSGALTERRSRASVAAPEVFWQGHAPAEAEAMLHQDLATWLTVDSFDPTPASARQVRSRRFPACRGWEQVIVVGRQAWRVTSAPIGAWSIEEESIAATAALGLSFATVSWGLPEDGGPPVLGRINPHPSLLECRPVWADVRRALLRTLLP